MATKTINNLSQTATGAEAADLLVINQSGLDLKFPISIAAPNMLKEVFDNYHLRLSAQDISTTDKEFDFTPYESGAGLKLAGFKITCPVTGGDGTAKGYFTTGLSFIDKIGNDLGASTFYLFGTGSVTFEFDPDNTRWILVEDNREKVYVFYEDHSGAASSSLPVPYTTKRSDNYNCVTTGASWKATAPKTAYYHISATVKSNSVQALSIYINGSASGILTYAPINNYPNLVTATIYLQKGQYVDIRGNNTASELNAFFTMVEV